MLLSDSLQFSTRRCRSDAFEIAVDTAECEVAEIHAQCPICLGQGGFECEMLIVIAGA